MESSTPVSIGRRVATSPDDLDDPLVSAHMNPLVMPSGPFWAEWITADLGGGLIAETTDFTPAVADPGDIPNGLVAVAVPLQCTVDSFNGACAVPGTLYVYGAEAEVMNASAGHARYGVASFSEHALDEQARRLGVDLSLPGRGEFRVVATRDCDALRTQFDHITALGRSGVTAPDPAVTQVIRSELVEILACSLSREDGQARGRPVHHPDYTRIVRECAHYAEKRNYQDLTMADLSEVAGVSERQVRAAFSSVFGISPRAYLRVAALYQVRRRLVTGPPSPDPVSRAATEFGFWHLGRFAGQYRSLFGELPHETLEHRLDNWPAPNRAVGRLVGA